MKPFETLDISPHYIGHDTPIYAHAHPTQPDGINAGVKAIEAALQGFELPDLPAPTYALTGDGTGVMASGPHPGPFSWIGDALNVNNWVLAAVIRYREITSPGSIYRLHNDAEGIYLDFGVTADYGCYLRIGATTYTSTVNMLSTDAPNVCAVHFHAGNIRFQERGFLGPDTPVTMTFPGYWNAMTAEIGRDFDGDIFRIGAGDPGGLMPWPFTLAWPPAPMRFGGANDLLCLTCYYPLHGGTGAVDHYVRFSGGTPDALPLVDGTWTAYDWVV